MGVVLHSGLCKSCNIKTSFGHSHGGHGHSHGGHDHSHGGHGHSHGGHGHSHGMPNCTTSLNNVATTSRDVPYVNINNTTVQNGIDRISLNSFARDDQLIMNDVESGCNVEPVTGGNTENDARLSFKGSTNINVRAAFIHVVGDFIQSIGVLVAAIIILINPEYKLADPICTFIFSFLVLCTTLTVLKDVMIIIMEGVPRSINYSLVKQSLSSLPGVVSVHSLNIWSITVDKLAVNVHLAIADDTTDWRKVLHSAVALLRKQYNIYHPTIQIEPYNDRDMKNCSRCLLP